MNEIVINVEGKNYIIDRNALLNFLTSVGKVFTNATPNNSINEITKVDEQGRTIING